MSKISATEKIPPCPAMSAIGLWWSAAVWFRRLIVASAVALAVSVLVAYSAPSSLPFRSVVPSATTGGSFSTTPAISSASRDSSLSTPPQEKLNSAPSPLPDTPSASPEDFQEAEPFVYSATKATFPPIPAPLPPPPSPFLPYLPVEIVNSTGGKTESSNSDSKTPPLKPKAPSLLKKVDEELIHAKNEIERASSVSDDAELYAPLFHNVSVFRKSYELMERILKVYIYDDGPRPIFHTPQLKGIYASEGWFLKLMEENRRFVVNDPNEAHLFYLPYSARQLQEALYKPNSHDMKPLLLFLKNYVDMLSFKYPFWNRTRGADHFIVACHDWGPYTTKWHDEFRRNTIKALCNADVSEGVFIRGKDVSLPETYIRMPKNPIRDMGGKRVSQRPILAFFAGNMHGRVRPILLDYWNEKDADMKIYGPLPSTVSKKNSYIQHMKSSKYCICPMGYEVNSPRIVEAIYYECVPVIIADNFVLPFEEVLKWSAFSVVIAEKDIPRLKVILTGISLRRYVKLQANVKMLQKHFQWHPRPVKYDIFHMILHSIWFNRLNQIQIPD